MLPLTVPGIVAGSTLVFSLSIAAYVIPTLLMGDAYQTLPTTIATSLLYLQDPQRGSVAGVVLLTLSLIVVLASATLGPEELRMIRPLFRASGLDHPRRQRGLPAGAAGGDCYWFRFHLRPCSSCRRTSVTDLVPEDLDAGWPAGLRASDGGSRVCGDRVSLVLGTLAAIAVVRGQFSGT